MLLCFLFFFAIADVLDLPIHKAESFICLEIDEDNHFQDAIDKTAEVAIKPISPSTTSLAEINPATISSAIASLCGADSATADRYEARNDAAVSYRRNF